jgi:hypothetical protein
VASVIGPEPLRLFGRKRTPEVADRAKDRLTDAGARSGTISAGCLEAA